VHLLRDVFDTVGSRPRVRARSALFVCTRNSARSQLAAGLWRELTHSPAASAGTHPAERVDPRAVDAARRGGIALDGRGPRALASVKRLPAWS
jgi:protein-tyrosine-phosphatase